MDRTEMVREGLASAPPVTVAALTFSGISLQDWVLIATLTWVGLQVSYFLYQRWKEFRLSKHIERGYTSFKTKYIKGCKIDNSKQNSSG